MHERISGIDIARGIGIFFIVLGHVLKSGYLEYFIFSFHVPLFFILSGICWRDSPCFNKFISKKFKTLMIPYYVFGLFSIIVYSIVGKYVSILQSPETDSISYSLYGLFFANSKTGYMDWNNPLWFLPCMFCANGLVFVIEKICKLKKICKLNRFFRILCILLFFAVNGLFQNVLKDIYLPLHFETSIGMAAFVELGILFKEIYTKKYSLFFSNIKLCFVMVFLLILNIFSILLNDNVRIDVRIDHYGNYVLYVIGAVSVSVIIILLSSKIYKNRVIEYLGTNSIGILVLHKFPIVFFQSFVPFCKVVLTQPNSFLGLITALFLTVTVLALCTLGYAILFRFCPFIFGKSRCKTKKI